MASRFVSCSCSCGSSLLVQEKEGGWGGLPAIVVEKNDTRIEVILDVTGMVTVIAFLANKLAEIHLEENIVNAK